MDDGDNDECILHLPVPWALMLGYEKKDVIAHLCQKLFFFRRDRLTLSEREQVMCSPGMENTSMNSLIIYGSVGNARNDAFLRLIRLARLTLVGDMASDVVVSPQVGDAVPNFMLYPLEQTAQVKSHYWWNCVFWALRCGIFRKMGRRRELVRQHVEEITSLTLDDKNFSFSNAGEFPLPYEELFFREYRSLLEVEQKQQVPLGLFHNACTEERISISSVAANVPTLFVMWASSNSLSMQWLRKNIFNVAGTTEGKEYVKLLATYLSSVDSDPWLRTVMQFVKIPERLANPDRKTSYRAPKRCQIVLINVDHDKNSALYSYQELLSRMQGWSSAEVSLMSLWAGSEGLQSDIASALNVTELPFIFVSTPTGALEKRMGERRFPRFTFFSAHTEEKSNQNASNGQESLIEMSGSSAEQVYWHTIKQKERMSISDNISRFISYSDTLLRFESCVDRCYSIGDSTTCDEKSERLEISSKVRLSGIISSRDLQKLKNELLILSTVKNFIFDVKVIEPSAPMLTELNPMTPTRYIHGTKRNITCSECYEVILIDESYHYRCIHCEQVEGVVCRRCFNDGKHPQHHVLLRVPTHAETTLHLLWGCSNVEPLSLYYGKVLGNVSDTHIGVYCNSCSKLIQGKRWKCALCYQYDLCSQCDEKNNHNILKRKAVFSPEISEGRDTSVATTDVHPKEHFYLCIRRGCGTKGDKILKPLLTLDPLKALLT